MDPHGKEIMAAKYARVGVLAKSETEMESKDPQILKVAKLPKEKPAKFKEKSVMTEAKSKVVRTNP